MVFKKQQFIIYFCVTLHYIMLRCNTFILHKVDIKRTLTTRQIAIE